MATELPDVFAAGDVALAVNATAGRRVHIEHWGDAIAQGEVAGRVAAGSHARSGPTCRASGLRSPDTHSSSPAGARGLTRSASNRLRTAPSPPGIAARDRIVGVLAHERDDAYERGRELIADGCAMALSAIVVVPARDEADRIAACLRALAAQTIGLDAFRVDRRARRVRRRDRGARPPRRLTRSGSTSSCWPARATGRAPPAAWAWSAPPPICWPPVAMTR